MDRYAYETTHQLLRFRIVGVAAFQRDARPTQFEFGPAELFIHIGRNKPDPVAIERQRFVPSKAENAHRIKFVSHVIAS